MGAPPLVSGDNADKITKRWLQIYGKSNGIQGDLQYDVGRTYPGRGARGAEVDILLDNQVGFELKRTPSAVRPGQEQAFSDLFSNVSMNYIFGR
jgi:hypothetical protein